MTVVSWYLGIYGVPTGNYLCVSGWPVNDEWIGSQGERFLIIRPPLPALTLTSRDLKLEK